MGRHVYILCSLFFCFTNLWSQTKIEIEGNVYLDRNIPASYANVLFLDRDSSFLFGTISDEQGRFYVKTEKTGSCFIKISYIGFKDVFRQVEIASSKNELGDFVLESLNINLSEVTINARRSITTMKNGNTLITVENTLLSTLGTAQDILKHVPGLTISDGELNMIGKGAPVVYIDNHKVLDLSILERLSSSDIKSVELITIPGVKYDADNRAVLEITTNKKGEKGFSFYTLDRIRKGYFVNNMESINLNYSLEHFDMFCNYTHSFYKTKHIEFSDQINTGHDTLCIQKNHNPNIEKSNWHILETGINYNFNANNSLGVRYTYARSPFYWELNNGEILTYVNDELFSSIHKDNYTNATNIHHYLNAFYHVDFSKFLHMQLDVDYRNILHDAHSYVIENHSSESSIIDMYRNRNNSLAAAKLNFDYDLQSSGKLNFGMNYSHIGAEGDFQNPQNIVADNNFSNSENKYSFFTSYAFKLQNTNIEAGVRYEYLKAKDYERGLAVKNKSYSDFFPYVSIKYPLKSVQLGIAFSERIERPSLGDLSNDVSYYDQYSYWYGNQLLLPQKIYDTEMYINYRFLQFKLNYQYIKNYIMDDMFTLPTSVLVTVTKPMNFPNYQLLGATLILEKDWGLWKGELSGSIYKPFFEVPGINGNIHFNRPYGSAVCNNTFSFPHDIITNLDMAYYSGGSMDNENYKPKGSIDIGIRKSFFNKKLVLSLQGTDLFKWMDKRYSGSINNIQFYQKSIRDSRSVSLTLTWKFNNYKEKYKGRSAAPDEIRRL